MIQNYKSSLRDRFLSSRNFLYRKEESIIMNFAVNKSARKILSVIEEDKGYKLPSRLKKDCDDYAHDYLGNLKYSPWLYVYSAMQEKFSEGWLPENFYIESVVNGLDKNTSNLTDMNFITSTLLNT